MTQATEAREGATKPPGQGAHAVALAEEEKRPRGQGAPVREVAPTPQKYPGAEVQEPLQADDDEPTVLLKVPAGHRAHAAAPDSLNRPAWQEPEQLDVDRPVVMPNLPAEQTMQLVLEVDVLYVPRGHGTAVVELEPAGQYAPAPPEQLRLQALSDEPPEVEPGLPTGLRKQVPHQPHTPLSAPPTNHPEDTMRHTNSHKLAENARTTRYKSPHHQRCCTALQGIGRWNCCYQQGSMCLPGLGCSSNTPMR
jgi:hypothetical protein